MYQIKPEFQLTRPQIEAHLTDKATKDQLPPAAGELSDNELESVVGGTVFSLQPNGGGDHSPSLSFNK